MNENVKFMITFLKTVPTEEIERRIDIAVSKGFIIESDKSVILEKLGLQSENQDKEPISMEVKPDLTVEEFRRRAEQKRRVEENSKANFQGAYTRPGKRKELEQQEENLDDLLDKIDDEIHNWKVCEQEEYTLEEINNDIRNLQIKQTELFRIIEPANRKEGDRYSVEERRKRVNEILGRIWKIETILKEYRNDKEGVSMTGIRQKVEPEKKKWYKHLVDKIAIKLGIKEPEEIKTIIVPHKSDRKKSIVPKVTVNEEFAQAEARRAAIEVSSGKSKKSSRGE